MIYERIKQLCDKKGISISELERRIGVSRGSICKIDKHEPSSTTLNKIAIELDTDSTYLLSGKENQKKKQADEFNEFITLFNKLNDKDKENIVNLMKSLGKGN